MQYQISERHGLALLSGELTADDQDAFAAVSERLLRSPGSHPVVIDLAGLDFIDATGVGMLLGASGDAQLLKRPFAVRAPGGQVRRVLEHFRLETILAIEPAEDA